MNNNSNSQNKLVIVKKEKTDQMNKIYLNVLSVWSVYTWCFGND